MSKKSGFIKKLCGIILSVFVLSSFVGNIEAFAYSEIPDYLDFGDSVVSINAGESTDDDQNRGSPSRFSRTNLKWKSEKLSTSW